MNTLENTLSPLFNAKWQFLNPIKEFHSAAISYYFIDLIRMSSIAIKTIATTPYKDQKPGTSGLRKKTPIFMEGHYLHNFIQVSLRNPTLFPVYLQLPSQGSCPRLYFSRWRRRKVHLVFLFDGIDTTLVKPSRLS